MDEYIDRKTAIKELGYYPAAQEYIRDIPASDVAPVQHGRWLSSHDEFCECSLCRYPVHSAWNKTNYCPNCGAKMDLEVDNEE